MTKKRFDLNLDRCVGCYACVVACKDQNNTHHEDDATLFRDLLTTGKSRELSYISMACMHCEDAPCIVACPTGAITKDEEYDMVSVDKALCIGCHSCAMSCPFGIPLFDVDGKMQKCQGCIERVSNELIPACVRICPTNALVYETEENIKEIRQTRLLRKTLSDK